MNVHIPFSKIPPWILNHHRFQYVFQKWIATPKFANSKETNWWYHRARLRTKSTGVQYVVDHIIPLNHPHVCGLHYHLNMQLLTYEQNAFKGNRQWPDMWMEQTDIEDGIKIPDWLKSGQLEFKFNE